MTRDELTLNACKEMMDTMYQLADRLATLASGALALSVTFTRGALPHAGCAVWFLRISWVSFLCTFAGYILIHLAKISVYQNFLDDIRSGAPTAPSNMEPPTHFHVGRYLLLLGFSSGLIFLALFGVFAP
jgi:hypothetical protein